MSREMRDGDVAYYLTCSDFNCKDHRDGFDHAHLERVERAEKTECKEADDD